MERATELGQEFQSMMKNAQKKNEVIGEIRGLGLLQAVELVKNPETREPVQSRKLYNILLNQVAGRGLWLVSAGRYNNVIRFMPPLTISRKQFINAVEIIIDVLNDNLDDLVK